MVGVIIDDDCHKRRRRSRILICRVGKERRSRVHPIFADNVANRIDGTDDVDVRLVGGTDRRPSEPARPRRMVWPKFPDSGAGPRAD
jgi:hypothetical protein